MKFRYTLVVSIILLGLGILLKNSSIPGGGALVALSISAYFILALIYVILSLVKKRDRVLSGLCGSFSLFVLAIGFKFMHWPGAGVMLVVTPQFIFVFAMIALGIRISKKGSLVAPAIFTSVAISTFYLMFRLMYWPGASMMFYLLILPIIILPIIFIVKEKAKLSTLLIAWCVFVLSIVVVQISPAHKRYAFFHLDGNENCYAYDRYSWFLYIDGEFEESEIYCQKAIDIYYNDPQDLELSAIDIGVLENHLELIKNRNWIEYQWPDEAYR